MIGSSMEDAKDCTKSNDATAASACAAQDTLASQDSSLHDEESSISIDVSVIVADQKQQAGQLDKPNSLRQSCERSEDGHTAECSVSSGETFKSACSISGGGVGESAGRQLQPRRSILREESRISEVEPPENPPSHQRTSSKVRFSTVLVRDYSITLGK